MTIFTHTHTHEWWLMSYSGQKYHTVPWNRIETNKTKNQLYLLKRCYELLLNDYRIATKISLRMVIAIER